jgi:integrase/recombinase XerD
MKDLHDHSPAVHVRRPGLDYQSCATGLDSNEVGALLVAAGLGPAAKHAVVSLLALNGLWVSEATGADIETLGLERGGRILGIVRKGGKRLVAQAHQGLRGSPASEASAVTGSAGPRAGLLAA